MSNNTKIENSLDLTKQPTGHQIAQHFANFTHMHSHDTDMSNEHRRCSHILPSFHPNKHAHPPPTELDCCCCCRRILCSVRRRGAVPGPLLHPTHNIFVTGARTETRREIRRCRDECCCIYFICLSPEPAPGPAEHKMDPVGVKPLLVVVQRLWDSSKLLFIL